MFSRPAPEQVSVHRFSLARRVTSFKSRQILDQVNLTTVQLSWWKEPSLFSFRSVDNTRKRYPSMSLPHQNSQSSLDADGIDITRRSQYCFEHCLQCPQILITFTSIERPNNAEQDPIPKECMSSVKSSVKSKSAAYLLTGPLTVSTIFSLVPSRSRIYPPSPDEHWAMEEYFQKSLQHVYIWLSMSLASAVFFYVGSAHVSLTGDLLLGDSSLPTSMILLSTPHPTRAILSMSNRSYSISSRISINVKWRNMSLHHQPRSYQHGSKQGPSSDWIASFLHHQRSAIFVGFL